MCGLKGKVKWRVLAQRGNVWAGKIHKTPQIVDTIEHFSDQIREASYLMKFDEFGIWNGAAYKVVKQDWKNGNDLDNICSKVVLGKDINWFAET